MVQVHNVIGRALNSIYLQAPHIIPDDEKNFVKYMQCWYIMVHVHHTGEETMFFPAVEEMTGVKDIMEPNISQHHAFHGGLDRFKEYVDAVLAGKEKYDGAKVVEIIDSFGSVLMQHLNDEIPTLLGLRQFGEEKMKGLTAVMEKEADEGMVSFLFLSISFPLFGGHQGAMC